MIWEYITLSIEQIRLHKVRSFLTLLSITIGVVSIVLMTSLAQSGLKTLIKGIEEIGGTRLIIIVEKNYEDKKDIYLKGLTLEDKEVLSKRLHYIKNLLGIKQLFSEVLSKKNQGYIPAIMATEPKFVELFAMKIDKGRNISQNDIENDNKVCVIGYEAYNKLFPDRIEPIGEEINIFGKRFKIIGLLKENKKFGVSFGFDWNDFIIIPLTLSVMDKSIIGELEIFIETINSSYNDIVKKIANSILAKRHRDIEDYQLLDFGGILKDFYKIFVIMEVIVGLIAGVALIIGGVGIMNIILASIYERIREIGIRKAIGASDSVIRLQFLIESTFLSVIGGILGIVIGVILSYFSFRIITHFYDGWVSNISSEAIILSFLVTLLVGIIFGYYPAKQAGSLSIIDCLRKKQGA